MPEKQPIVDPDASEALKTLQRGEGPFYPGALAARTHNLAAANHSDLDKRKPVYINMETKKGCGPQIVGFALIAGAVIFELVTHLS